MQTSAVAQNAMLDAAISNKSNNTGVSDTGARNGNGMVFVLVRNNTGDDQDRYAALAIETPLVTPDENDATYRSRIMFDGTVPTTDDVGKFCILFEPLADQQVGRALVFGAALTQINITNESDGYADVVDGSTVLTSAATGAAKILWKAEDTGEGIDAVVLLGSGGGGGSVTPGQMGQVEMTVTDGHADMSFDFFCTPI